MSTPSAEHWNARYRDGNTPWERRRPPPDLLELIERLGSTKLCVLVPGAGHGTDAIAWAAAGHDVTAVDHAPDAVRLSRERSRAAGHRLRILLADILDLPTHLCGTFDAVWEQTCFCALAPDQRRGYVGAMARALRPGGLLYGLFWEHGRSGGPPYNVSEACVRSAFDDLFEIISVVAATPLPDREREFVVVLRRRAWHPRRS